MEEITVLDRFRGCMLGGALGDALGYPVEFLSADEINKQYGKNGITDLRPDKQLGAAPVSDDTQIEQPFISGNGRGNVRTCYCFVFQSRITGKEQAVIQNNGTVPVVQIPEDA